MYILEFNLVINDLNCFSSRLVRLYVYVVTKVLVSEYGTVRSTDGVTFFSMFFFFRYIASA